MTNRNAGRHETWLFSAPQAQPVPSAPPPHVQSKQARQTPVSERARTRGGDRERDEGDMETVRHTELLPSDVPDGPI